MSGTVKLQKYIADAGIMSRRAAEREIEAGNVAVNGVTASLGDRVDPENDEVTLRGRTVPRSSGALVYIMLNKPAGVISTMNDENDRGRGRERRTVADLVGDVPARVFPVGRLDMYSDGLLIMTNDGGLANALSHPGGGVEKVYRVTLNGCVNDGALHKLASPMTITEADGTQYRLRECGVNLVERDDERTVIEMTLREGRNRQIRRMCGALGLKISRLTRISECGVALDRLPVGKWRYLTEEEKEKLIYGHGNGKNSVRADG